ncbi:MAG: glycosyltransferase family 2 protein [Candidatus Moranbacteria bacterium]|nr:glycosyltransferase family 2 protein [Candidatus Moranbacteria bacterium]
MQSPSITILVPCYNEGKTIRKCAEHWLDQTHPADEIIVVDDCSTDNTREVLQEFSDRIKVIALPKNTGNKSFVQEEGLRHVVTDVFIATDADTIMDRHFVKRVYDAFQDEKVMAFAGYIQSLKCNWLTACREIDYLIGQDLHKVAQNNIRFLFVIPGCAGAFRTATFKEHITFDHDTLTEDLDFTYKTNKGGHEIVYDRRAIVYTQDPRDLKSYINQMRRWYSGGWQNLIKHIDAAKRPMAALELSLIYIEGMFFSVLLFVLPIINIRAAAIVLIPYAGLVLLLGSYAALRRRRPDLLLYAPAYVILSYLHAYILLEQFVKEIIFRKRNLTWFHPERREIV